MKLKTVKSLIEDGKVMLTPCEVYAVTGISPQVIRMQARTNPAKLGFPVVVAGSTVRVPAVKLAEFIGEVL